MSIRQHILFALKHPVHHPIGLLVDEVCKRSEAKPFHVLLVLSVLLEIGQVQWDVHRGLRLRPPQPPPPMRPSRLVADLQRPEPAGVWEREPCPTCHRKWCTWGLTGDCSAPELARQPDVPRRLECTCEIADTPCAFHDAAP